MTFFFQSCILLNRKMSLLQCVLLMKYYEEMQNGNFGSVV